MGKGRAALTYLPQTNIAFVGSAGDQSVEAVKAALNKVASLQESLQAGTFLAETCKTSNPYDLIKWDIVSLTAASGTATLTSAIATDVVTINGLAYTGVAGVKSDNTEFSIDTSDTAAAADLADSINNDVRVGTLDDVSATSAVGVVTITQTVAGYAGNATTLVSSDATIVVSGATMTGGIDYELTFDSEVSVLGSAIGKAALSTRRLIDVILVPNANLFSVRSALTFVNFIDKLEDKVAETGVGSTGDATYTDIPMNGFTPFETFTWTVTKSGNDYTVTATANS